MGFTHKHRRNTRPSRVRSAIEHYLHHLAHRHPLLAVVLSLVTVALCFVVVLVRVVTTLAVKTVVIAVRLTIVITLVVCRNIFRTFPA